MSTASSSPLKLQKSRLGTWVTPKVGEQKETIRGPQALAAPVLTGHELEGD